MRCTSHNLVSSTWFCQQRYPIIGGDFSIKRHLAEWRCNWRWWHLVQPAANVQSVLCRGLQALPQPWSKKTKLSLTGRAQHLITVLSAEYNSRNNCWHVTSDRLHWFRTLYMPHVWDTDNEIVYSTWNDLPRSLKVMCNVIFHQIAWTIYMRPEK